MNTQKKLLLTLLFMLTALISWGQLPPYPSGGTPSTPSTPMIGPQLPPITFEQGAQMSKYMKGSGDFEDWFMEGFTKLDTFIETLAKRGGKLGGVIGTLGALIYFSVIGYRMQSGSAEWDVEPMIKPTIILIILTNWVPFTQMIEYPFSQLSEMPKSVFKEIEKETKTKREIRYTKQLQVLNANIKFKAEIESKVNFYTKAIIGQGAMAVVENELISPMLDELERLNYGLQKVIGETIETICLMILRVGVYLIFFIQKIWIYVLIVLGPIGVGMSLIPGFESSLTNWIAKFINVNLYTFIAYTIINIGQQIIMAGYEMDISRLSAIVNNKGEVINYHLLLDYSTYGGMINSVIFPCVGYLVTGIAVLMTPTIADAIISAGGAGVMTKAHRAAAKVNSVSGKTLISKFFKSKQ